MLCPNLCSPLNCIYTEETSGSPARAQRTTGISAPANVRGEAVWSLSPAIATNAKHQYTSEEQNRIQNLYNILWRVDSRKRPWCWEGPGAGGEGDGRGGDGWMASPTQWTWVWVNSVSWWWTGRPGVLQFMGSQRVRRDWTTELN